ncbi:MULTISPECIES: lyase family protein [unclassified Arthrobacter]|uniref:lyase family protein n=1 Tax=unclassified Arthrobacter TaxID=235627 RepID=UPI002106AE6C|nr:lyase family protein [Arthrobacter sp. zg-Y1171]MCQ1985560.1 lyase family protein [Arthrobacter sp. zg-Y844]MCQ1994723.1 lyase family protein [Arthrobacter sp. zg-Y1171]UWX81204.1 lyase family protein [Arthrobacter sp. zg-Y1171]
MGAADSADYGLLSPAWAGTRVAELTGDRQLLQALLDVELEWVRVLASAGLADPEAPAAVAAVSDASRYDAASLAERAQGGGNPVIPLLADLRTQARESSPKAAAAIHRGATSQDIMDTALMLLARRALETIITDADRAAAALGATARRHAATLCVARTLTQHSLPSTFGLRAAQWLHGVGSAAQGLRTAAGNLQLQWGGASGTLAAVSLAAGSAAPGTERTTAFDLTARLARGLGLAEPLAPWQTNRLPVTALGAALQDFTAAAGKVANDVLLLSRPEIGEVCEPRAAGRGGSSAMPQKQNPVLSVLIRSAALAAPGYGLQLNAAAAAADDERPSGSWHVEWQALRSLLRLAGGAAAKLAELAEGLQVSTDALARNLESAGPLVVSEKIMAVAAPLLDDGVPGRGKEIIADTVARSLSSGEPFEELLRAAVPTEVLSDTELKSILDPAEYLGEATALIERITAAYPGKSPV